MASWTAQRNTIRSTWPWLAPIRYAASSSRTVEGVNIVSVSWGDHLSSGEGDGRLDTHEKPAAPAARVARREPAAGTLHWRMLRSRIPGTHAALRATVIRRRRPRVVSDGTTSRRSQRWPARRTVAVADVTVFDEGGSWHPSTCAASAITTKCMGSTSPGRASDARSSAVAGDRSCRTPGRRAWCRCRIPRRVARSSIGRTSLIASTEFDSLFVCLFTVAASHTADQFGFNEPARRDFRARYGVDVELEAFDIQDWRDLLGTYLTALLTELRIGSAGSASGCRSGARGDVLGPPIGNTTLPWRDWVRLDLVDRLVIDQNSSQCPSMWHQLWPMHRARLRPELSG